MSDKAVRVIAARQVVEFVGKQAPESRHKLRVAVRGLAQERGDIKALEGRLIGYHRLSVGSFRVVFAYAKGGAEIHCIVAERRDVVYVLLERMLRDQAGR